MTPRLVGAFVRLPDVRVDPLDPSRVDSSEGPVRPEAPTVSLLFSVASPEPLQNDSSPGADDSPSVHFSLTKNPQNIDVLDHLMKLGALRHSGLLTQEEFELQRAELRARLW